MMEKVNVGMNVIDSRNNNRGVVTEKNSKAKTVLVKYETGEEKPHSVSTLKKYFSEYVPEPEKVEKKGEKKERKKREKKANPAKEKFISELSEIIEKAGYIATTYEKVGPRFVVLRVPGEKKVKFELYTGEKELLVNMKVLVADALGYAGYKVKRNYYLPAVLKFPYEDAKKELTKILPYYVNDDIIHADV